MKLDGYSINEILSSKSVSSSSRLNGRMDRRMQGPISPNASLVFRGFPTKRYGRRALAIISWWLGDFGYLIRAELENDNDIVTKLCCHSKAATVEVLQSKFSERDFFGNLLPRMIELINSIDLAFREPRKPRRTLRRRGYRDQGTLRPEHRKHRNEPDFSLSELQELIEQRRSGILDTYHYLLGWVGCV